MFKRFNKITFILLIVYVLLGTALVYLRPINSSEGYTIRIAKDIWSGNQLYVNLLYHHTPLLPYFYSVFSDFGFASYILLRYVSLILTLIFILLVYLHIYKFTEDKVSANFGISLIIFNGLFID